MKSPHVVGDASRTARDEFPRFELSYLYDSEDQPTEVTIYPESNEYDISTNWLTVDLDAAIPIDQIL